MKKCVNIVLNALNLVRTFELEPFLGTVPINNSILNKSFLFKKASVYSSIIYIDVHWYSFFENFADDHTRASLKVVAHISLDIKFIKSVSVIDIDAHPVFLILCQSALVEFQQNGFLVNNMREEYLPEVTWLIF